MRVAIEWVRCLNCMQISWAACLLLWATSVVATRPHRTSTTSLDVEGPADNQVDIKPRHEPYNDFHRATAVISRSRRHRKHHNRRQRDNNWGHASQLTDTTDLAGDGLFDWLPSADHEDSINNKHGRSYEDDEAPKSNPLIESEPVGGFGSRLKSEGEQQVAGGDAYVERPYLSENEEDEEVEGQNKNAKNIKPLQSGQSDHHEGAEGPTRTETIHSRGEPEDDDVQDDRYDYDQSNRDERPLVGLSGQHTGPRDWCHMNCNINDGVDQRHSYHRHQRRRRHHHRHQQDRSKIVCASDGRFYESMCELRRFACLNDVHLFKRPIWQCSTRSKTINHNEHELKLTNEPTGANRNDGHPHTSDDAPPSLSSGTLSLSPSPTTTATAADNNNNNNNSERESTNNENNNQLYDHKVRFIELKRHCNRGEFGPFKAALLRKFGGKIEAMFRYFDANNDGYIEAHELWPRPDEPPTTIDDNANLQLASADASKPIRSKYYTEMWENHPRDCQSRSSSPSDQHHQHPHRNASCWFFLDFAFEPHFSWSPCSLSHLMLYESNSNLNYKFDLSTFAAAFSDIEQSPIGLDDQLNNPSTTEVNRATTHLSISLGQSRLVPCMATGNEAIHLHDSKGQQNNNNDNLPLEGGGAAGGDNDDDLDNQMELATGDEPRDDDDTNNDNLMQNTRCMWTRYNWPISSVRDQHVSIEFGQRISANSSTHSTTNSTRPMLFLRETQLYLSGQYKCTCTSRKSAKIISHLYKIQVLAEPKVIVRPSRQWSLANSRASFECHHDFIDTRFKSRSSSFSNADGQLDENDQNVGMKIDWFKDSNLNGETSTTPNATMAQSEPSFSSSIIQSDGNSKATQQTKQPKISPSEGRASISMASTRLALESLQPNDTGDFVCRVQVGVPIDDGTKTTNIKAESRGSLLVREQARAFVQEEQSNLAADPSQGLNWAASGGGSGGAESETYLWMFHDNGISVFKVQNDDGGGQEMELVREINGHSLVSPEVDGNWNQLTLCGGLNQEQVVICEWSDNALYVNVPLPSANNNNYNNNFNYDNDKIRSRGQRARRTPTQQYIYVGQPNLNRVIVLDGREFEIVAIINTEPQPRKLFPARPNKIHLSKWVRRRLSPIANARWLAAIGSHAHELQLTPPDSQLGSLRPPNGGGAGVRKRRLEDVSQFVKRQTVIRHTFGRTKMANGRAAPMQPSSKLIQHDIWLLCYGQPLVVSPSGDDHLDEPTSDYSAPTLASSSKNASNNITSRASMSMMMNSISDKPPGDDTSGAPNPMPTRQREEPTNSLGGPIEPFTPRLSHPLAWSMAGWSVGTVTARESRLRNRKSVQIIQSTFFPRFLADPSKDAAMHGHWPEATPADVQSSEGAQGVQQPQEHEHQQQQQRQGNENSTEKQMIMMMMMKDKKKKNKSADVSSPVSKFKRATVSTTHYVFAGSISGGQQMTAATRRYQMNQFDLIQDLSVPMKPSPLLEDSRYKQHHAYVSHYDEQRLYRVSMDEYSYDRQIDLQDCDPINLVVAAQGLLIVQCRARITHSLIGQLVLDELTTSRLQFNENIRAQEGYLSPDNRYLISIYTNKTTGGSSSEANSNRRNDDMDKQKNNHNQQQERHQAIIYVQLVSVEGLKLQYEIKTSLDISQCSFVWKEGYYAAMFVSSNRQEQQTEVLSLRLADGRLELMVRVAGVASTSRHKEVLKVLPELQVAALSTSQATYIIDIEENRVTQTLHRRQSTPTLLWVAESP